MQPGLFQILIWSSAHLSIIPEHKPKEFGCGLQGNDYVAQTTDYLIAPKAVVELVSCNCKGHCSSRRCSCAKNKLPCTDYCGCTETCENTDVISDNLMDDIDEDENEY